MADVLEDRDAVAFGYEKTMNPVPLPVPGQYKFQ
jgi:hypothetical protein